MAMVFDDYRNLVAQEFGNTREAVHRKINAKFEDKGLGTYSYLK
jgi:hypothetical protein